MNWKQARWIGALVAPIIAIVPASINFFSSTLSIAVISIVSILYVFLSLIFLRHVYDEKTDGLREYHFPLLRSRLGLLFVNIAIPLALLAVVIPAIYYLSGVSNIEVSMLSKTIPEIEVKKERDCNGQLGEIASMIGIARFSKDEEDFSDFVSYEIESKLEYDDVGLLSLDEYLAPGIASDNKVNQIRYESCIDTGMIVHGARNSEQEMFVCKIHFFNFHRPDTLIKNPTQVEFSYQGHSRYLADFILAHEYYRRGNYDQAVRLLLSARKQGVDTSFISLTDYYLGNVYLELGKPVQAERYFRKSLSNESVEGQAIWQIEKLRKLKVLEELRVEPRRFEGADFRGVLKYRLSKIHGVIVSDNEIARVDADSWVENKSPKYTSIWLFKLEDSLFCYSLTGNLLAPEKYHYIINKDWSRSTKYGGFSCVLRTNYVKPHERSDTKWSVGWSIYFFPKSFKGNYWSNSYLRYSWYRKLCEAGSQPYIDDPYGLEHIEAKRWLRVRSEVLEFSNQHNLGIVFTNDWNSFLKDEDEL